MAIETATPNLSHEVISRIRRALQEDIGAGDVTTESIVTADTTATAHIVAKQDGVVAGLDVVSTVFLLLHNNVRFKSNASEGSGCRT